MRIANQMTVSRLLSLRAILAPYLDGDKDSLQRQLALCAPMDRLEYEGARLDIEERRQREHNALEALWALENR